MNISQEKYVALKKFVYLLDHGKCHICKRYVEFEKATLDHIIPTAMEGRERVVSSSEYWNLRIDHQSCNSRRSNGRIAGQIRLNLGKY